MSDVTFTKLGHAVFSWDRLIPCEPAAWKMWITLYGSPRAVLVGLWVAGLATLGEVSRLPPDMTVKAIDDLLEHELVEYDRKREVLRLTEFPDRAARPDNGRAIKGMYNRFRMVPQCDIRDAHVETIRWLVEDPLRPPKPDHVSMWDQTFGQVKVPPARKRGVRRLLDADTSNPFQASLFTVETPNVSRPLVSDTHTDTHRSTIYDLRSDSDLGEESKPRAKSLGLVPLPSDLPFSVAEMLEVIAAESGGRFSPGPVDERSLDDLCATIRSCAATSVALADLRVVGKWLAAGGLSYRTDLGPVWAAKPGELLNACGAARLWANAGAGPIGPARRLPARAEPTPVGAHGTGRRVL